MFSPQTEAQQRSVILRPFPAVVVSTRLGSHVNFEHEQTLDIQSYLLRMGNFWYILGHFEGSKYRTLAGVWMSSESDGKERTKKVSIIQPDWICDICVTKPILKRNCTYVYICNNAQYKLQYEFTRIQSIYFRMVIYIYMCVYIYIS